MISENNEIIVNMPNCINILFYFNEGQIVKSKRISFDISNDAIVFYKINEEIQDKINVFLNPNAIY